MRSGENPPAGKPFLKDKQNHLPTSLNEAIKEHVGKERSSFHTPGHKGRPPLSNDLGKVDFWARDLCESIPSLDDLYSPHGVLQELENRAAQVWRAHSSLISVNGASAGIIACLIMLAKRGSLVLVPRNCHTSFISGLILSGLTPVWFEPIWDSSWGFWGPTTAKEIKKVLQTTDLNCLAAVSIVSPTYAGSISNVNSIAELVHSYGIPLLVDEAHGAHLLTPETESLAAIKSGADLVVQSLHKTLSGLTQTGIVHISSNGKEQFQFSKAELKRALNLVQSTSPSYLFLSSIDQLVSSLESGNCLRELSRVHELSERLKEKLSKFSSIKFYQHQSSMNFTHILFRIAGTPVEKVCEFLVERGIYVEACLGTGVLVMLGLGSRISDVDSLVFALQELIDPKSSDQRKRPWLTPEVGELSGRSARLRAQTESSHYSFISESKHDFGDRASKFADSANGIERFDGDTLSHELTDYLADREIGQPVCPEQELPPRLAALMPSHTVPKEEAIGLIAAECIAFCPPGWLITVPGARITKDVLKYSNIEFISVINEPT